MGEQITHTRIVNIKLLSETKTKVNNKSVYCPNMSVFYFMEFILKWFARNGPPIRNWRVCIRKCMRKKELAR